MEPIFPGMDPYLEAPGLWQDVHASMIAGIRDELQAQLLPRYVALITPYIAFESLEIMPLHLVSPDISLYERDLILMGTSAHAVAIEPAPLVGMAVMNVPTRYARVEVRTVADATLVTAIEILSPADKRPGSDGADAYARKRQQLFFSEAHLLELDLLRGGQRPRLAEPLPPAPYFVFLSRADKRPRVEIWPIALHAALPTVPVPLLRPDPDVALNLGRVLHQIYRNARYDVQVDYRQTPPPPALSAEEATWLDAHLHERGLRV